MNSESTNLVFKLLVWVAVFAALLFTIFLIGGPGFWDWFASSPFVARKYTSGYDFPSSFVFGFLSVKHFLLSLPIIAVGGGLVGGFFSQGKLRWAGFAAALLAAIIYLVFLK